MRSVTPIIRWGDAEQCLVLIMDVIVIKDVTDTSFFFTPFSLSQPTLQTLLEPCRNLETFLDTCLSPISHAEINQFGNIS